MGNRWHTHTNFPFSYYTRIHGLDFTNASSLSKNFHDKSTTARKFTSLLLLVTKRWTHAATEGTHIESHIQPKKMLTDLSAVFAGLADHRHTPRLPCTSGTSESGGLQGQGLDTTYTVHTPLGAMAVQRWPRRPPNKEGHRINKLSRTMRYVSKRIR